MSVFEVFQGLSKSETRRIFDSGVIRPLNVGETLFRKGDPGHEMYVILTGRIVIVDQFSTQKNTLAKLGAGELFGEMAMFEKQHERSADAVVDEPAQVLVLSEDKLVELLDKKIPRRFLVNIIAVLSHRLRVTNRLYMEAKYGTTTEED